MTLAAIGLADVLAAIAAWAVLVILLALIWAAWCYAAPWLRRRRPRR